MKIDPKALRLAGMAGLLLVSALLATGAAVAQQPAASAAPTESQREAAALLKSMADYLAGMEYFRCTTTNRYETVQSNGEKVESSETRYVFLARPQNRLRVEEESSDLGSDLILFDGRQITVVSAGFNVYAQAPQPRSLEDALVYFVRDLRMRAPLALLLSTHVRTDLLDLAKNVDYVERTKVGRKDAHHVAAQSESVDFEFWIADGKKPLPLRVVITYKTAPGQPKFWSDFSSWQTNKELADRRFELELPEGARKIPFAVQLSALGATAPDAAQVTP